MLSLYYHELVGNIEKCHRKRYLILDDSILDQVSEKIKKVIATEYDTKLLINTDDKLADENTLENVVILVTCIIKDDGKFNPQIF